MTFFFCYDAEMSWKLTKYFGFRFITEALHPRTRKKFWLYGQSPELMEALSQIKQQQQQLTR